MVLRRPRDRRLGLGLPRRGAAARRCGTVWRAGPHGRDKGACLCHGTAGNGYALLKTFERTQDELWLDRARSFAVHALEQAAAGRSERGRGRYSLWTGDVGVAVFAADCLLARTRYPVLETWE